MAKAAGEKPVHPFWAALAAAGLTEAEFCVQARVSSTYLRRLLRHGAPYDTAFRMAAVLGCRIDLFLGSSLPRASKQPAKRGKGAGATRRAPRSQKGPAAANISRTNSHDSPPTEPHEDV